MNLGQAPKTCWTRWECNQSGFQLSAELDAILSLHNWRQKRRTEDEEDMLDIQLSLNMHKLDMENYKK